jgi:hypothetical protein
VETRDFDAGVTRFVEAIAQHRHFARQVDPPAV